MKQFIIRVFTPFMTVQLYACIGVIWLLVNAGIILANIVFQNNIAQTLQINSIIFITASSLLLYYLINKKRDEKFSTGIKPVYRLLRALKAYNECHKALIRTNDERQLINEVCRIFVEVGGYRMAWVGLASDDAKRTITPVAGWGDDQDFIEIFKTKCMNKDLDKGPIKTAIKTGKPVVIQDKKRDPACELCQIHFLRHIVCSAVYLPLSNQGKAFAALIIYSAGKFAFDEEEVTLLTNLAADLSYGIAALRLNEENRAAEQQRQLLESVVTQMSPGLFVLDHKGIIQYVNPSAAAIVGLPEVQMLGDAFRATVCRESNEPFCEAFMRAVSNTNLNSVSFKYQRPDGAVLDLELLTWAVCNHNAEEHLRVGMLRDITYEVQLEMQLRRAQRMEAIGILAGGIAHDFNNALASIITCTEMALDSAKDDSNLNELLEIVLGSGQRGKQLVRQILTFSRQTEQEFQEVQLDMIVKECLKLLRSTLTPSIEIRLHIGQELDAVFADPTQMHQIVMNLCTNAVHAMRGRGQGLLELSIANYDPDEDMAAFCITLAPGSKYQRMTVRDNGHGMDAATIERIFDPFFSTKGKMEGTGLGLSVIHGIISKLDGGITVKSVVGQGTQFDVYLPTIANGQTLKKSEVNEEKPATGVERILLVDDDEDLLFSITLMLQKLGYNVTSQNDPVNALELFGISPYSFDLVITDQAMPNLSGIQLAEELAALRPELPIILCTGFDPTSSYGADSSRQIAGFITEVAIKPLERYELAQTVRRVLDVTTLSGAA
ncbi:MAG: ATP-binding protein [Desulfuromonadaceae bacterium]|nr:ATP-binding protein [Desulfuromonadaceae bacterium]MDD2847697.1 ATP-binding protein [Desulfuromonadaceae bacterium]MDD4131057.1 ATP-binding protein [Desulfuromonadaceae bacterium]